MADLSSTNSPPAVKPMDGPVTRLMKICICTKHDKVNFNEGCNLTEGNENDYEKPGGSNENDYEKPGGSKITIKQLSLNFNSTCVDVFVSTSLRQIPYKSVAGSWV